MEAKFCRSCGKKSTARRSVNQQTAICSECHPPDAAEPPSDATAVIDPPQVDDDEPLSNISFGTLKAWLELANNSLVAQVEQRLNDNINSVKRDLAETKKTVEKLDKELKECKKSTSKVASLENQVKEIEDSTKSLKKVSDDNLKYLINLDRNERRQNIVIFGVPEDGKNLDIGGTISTTDDEKFSAISDFVGTPLRNEISAIFRLGKVPVDEDKVRPIKVKCVSSTIASKILKESKKLKDLPNYTIYIKADKTKGEVEEYRRLGGRKTQLMEEYPVNDGDEPRVVLEKGIPLVNIPAGFAPPGGVE